MSTDGWIAVAVAAYAVVLLVVVPVVFKLATGRDV